MERVKKALFVLMTCLLVAILLFLVFFVIDYQKRSADLFDAIDRNDAISVRRILSDTMFPRCIANSHRHAWPWMLFPAVIGRNDTALTEACFSGQEEIIYTLLEFGADINKPEPLMGETPLMCILKPKNRNRFTVAADFLSRGADPSKQSYTDNVFSMAVMPLNPADEAEIRESVAFLQLLISYGSAPDCPEYRQSYTGSLLGIAAEFNNWGVIEYLLDENLFSVDDVSEEGMTALMLAARNNSVEAARALLAHGANMALKSKEGFTALDYAEQAGNEEIVSLLKRAMPSS